MSGKKRKRYRLRPRFFVITGTAFILLAAGIVLLVRSCMAGEEPPPPLPEQSPSDPVQSLDEEISGDPRYLSETLFVGDSRTRGLATYGFVPNRQVFAEDGLNHRDARRKELFDPGDGVKRILAAAVGERSPKRVVVSFGINGMDFMEEEDYFEEYEDLLDEIMASSPQSIYILQAIYPVSADFSAQNPGMSNETISRYNERLKELAQEKEMFFLNTAEALQDEDGALSEPFDAGDGLHMSREAYKVIVRYIREHPVNSPKQP